MFKFVCLITFCLMFTATACLAEEKYKDKTIKEWLVELEKGTDEARKNIGQVFAELGPKDSYLLSDISAVLLDTLVTENGILFSDYLLQGIGPDA